MGNFNTNKYQVNNSSMSSKKTHSFLHNFNCNVIVKRNKKKKHEGRIKSKSLNFDKSDSICNLKDQTENLAPHSYISSKSLISQTLKTDENNPYNSIISDTHLPENTSEITENYCLQSDNSEINKSDKSVSYNSDYFESYKSYLCRKNRYISSPRTCIDHFKLSNYTLEWNVPERGTTRPSERGRLQVRISKSMDCENRAVRTPNDGTTRQNYSQLSDSSLNSDDLMLGTDVNLDQADDDVSKDYNASEKDDPFLYENKNSVKEFRKPMKSSAKYVRNISIEASADESEKNDIVSFDSSRESSASIQRKNFSKGYNLRPHSFSSPLRPSNNREQKPLAKRNSNLSTVDSVDFAWTWISTSETANLSQDVSNLKLMLLKMKRLLLDETSNDSFIYNSRNNGTTSSVFSEPCTPICNNSLANSLLPDPDPTPGRQWESMTKEMLIQELCDLYQQNGDLQYQLKEKCRIIEFLQDQQQNYKNYPRRLHSTSSKGEICNRRIIRSSTFETASTLNHQTYSQDSEFSAIGSQDTRITQLDCRPQESL